MSKLGTWSTTPGNNNSTPPDGWPEGQAPSTINDCARQMMADIRTAFGDLQYFDTGNTPSYLSATTFSLGAADTTNFKVGRRIKLHDASTLYGTIESVSSTFVSVRLDSGALTASLSSCAIAIVDSSLPDIAYNGRSVIINGCMDIWQRGTSFSAASGTVRYTSDRWAVLHSSDANLLATCAERSASSVNVPTVAQAGQYISNSLRLSVSAADATLAAGQYAQILYKVEGYDWRRIAHKPNMLSFWAKSNRTGTYHVSLHNSPISASFVQAYTLSAANTWTRFAVTVPEAPTTATWNYSQSTGLIVSFTLASGSTYQAGGAGNWTAGEFIATSAQQNFLASAGNVFLLTGVSLHDGTQVLPLQVRPHGEELALCQRYYWRGLPCPDLNFPAYTAGSIMSWPCAHPVTMRQTPTAATSLPGITMAGLASNPIVTSMNQNGYRLLVTASVAFTNCQMAFGASDFFEFDSEL